MFASIPASVMGAIVLFLSLNTTFAMPTEFEYVGRDLLMARTLPSHTPPSSPEPPRAPKRAKTLPNFPSMQPVQMNPSHGPTNAGNPGAHALSSQLHAPERLNEHQMAAASSQGRQSLLTQPTPPNRGRPGNVASFQSGDRLHVTSSQTGVGTGNNAAMHPKLQGVVNQLEGEGKFQGSSYGVPGKNQGLHAEMHAINNDVHATDKLPQGGQSSAHNVKYDRKVKACASCTPVLNHLDITDLGLPASRRPQRSSTMRRRWLQAKDFAFERELYARSMPSVYAF
jgi:hypothetical protein